MQKRRIDSSIGPRTRLDLNDAFPTNPIESLLDTMIGLLEEIRDACVDKTGTRNPRREPA